jgi:hypothetical protein
MELQRDFLVSADADDLTRELEQRLAALSADQAQLAEPFRSSRSVMREGLAWFVSGLTLYAAAWLWATHAAG